MCNSVLLPHPLYYWLLPLSRGCFGAGEDWGWTSGGASANNDYSLGYVLLTSQQTPRGSSSQRSSPNVNAAPGPVSKFHFSISRLLTPLFIQTVCFAWSERDRVACPFITQTADNIVRRGYRAFPGNGCGMGGQEKGPVSRLLSGRADCGERSWRQRWNPGTGDQNWVAASVRQDLD